MQSSTTVIIVSESSLLSVALQNAMDGDFAEVQRYAHLKDVTIDENWPTTVLIVESSYPEVLVEDLKKLGEAGDLSRAIILLRAHQDFGSFIDLVGHAGAILPETCTIEEVGLIARIVRAGISVAPSVMLREIQSSNGNAVPAAAEMAKLTEREESVLCLIAQGSSNKVIARHLQISDSTVRVHVRSLLKKLGLQNRTQAALLASRRRVRPTSSNGDGISP